MLDATRQALIDAGRRHFGEVGYAATSMDDLTASASLTRGALYHHFGGKSGLLAAVVEAVDAELGVSLDAAAAEAPDPLGALTARCVAYIELTQAPDVQQILFHDAPSVLPAAVESSTASCIRSITDAIDRAQRAGDVSTQVRASTLAVLLNGALVDASRWVAAGRSEDHAARQTEAIAAARLIVARLGSRR
ncbi:TetR/AcrR family transcriptional regulator [Streptomyces sp. NPDC014872]|uniref:TetR/AcrR family transcriptional regulator n=1 Tax=Streptomyces sp. NPDC014872 TaxID=3364926 RepID=UPI0036F9B894